MPHHDKIRILFVGNDVTPDCYLKAELEQFGFEVDYLSSEVGLVLELAANGKNVDVLLIDATATGINAIARNDVFANIHIPVLFIIEKNERALAGKIGKESRRECIEKDSGMSEYNLRIKRLVEDSRHDGGDSDDEPIDAFALHEMIFDGDGKPVDYRFLDADSKFLRRLGKTREELVGKTVMELYPKTERVWIESFGRVALTGVPEIVTQYSAEFNRYFEARAYSPEKNKFLVLFIDLDKLKGAHK